MSELTQTLKILVTRYPGTMAELARKASIDRSTLYKIVSGQRTPREFQLEHLADALELSDDQRSALLLQYKQRGRGPDPRLRAELHHLLEVSFRVEDFTHREGLISNEAASQLHCSEQYIEGSRAVSAAVASLVANHILSGDTRPLLLSPFTNPTLDHVLVERFSAADGAPGAPGIGSRVDDTQARSASARVPGAAPRRRGAEHGGYDPAEYPHGGRRQRARRADDHRREFRCPGRRGLGVLPPGRHDQAREANAYSR